MFMNVQLKIKPIPNKEILKSLASLVKKLLSKIVWLTSKAQRCEAFKNPPEFPDILEFLKMVSL